MEKSEIIKRLEKIASHAIHIIGEPPFVMSLDDGIALVNAVRLLKVQEPKKIVDAGVHDMNNHHKIYYGNCPSCERRLYHKSSKYCPWCGQAVKWE